MSALTPRQMFLLNEACNPIREAFGSCPYLVGTAGEIERTTYRDVDVRLILDDEQFDRIIQTMGKAMVIFMGFAIGEYLASRTGLPIDFQLQRRTEANEKHKGKVRNALGILGLEDYHGDALP